MRVRVQALMVLAGLAACSAEVADGGDTDTDGPSSSSVAIGAGPTSAASGPTTSSGGDGGDGAGGATGSGGGSGGSSGGGLAGPGSGGGGAGSTEGLCPSEEECPTAHCTEICGARIAIADAVAPGGLPSRLPPRRLRSARAGDFVVRPEAGDAALRDPSTGALLGTIEGSWQTPPTFAVGATLIAQVASNGYLSTSFYDASDPAAVVAPATWYPGGSGPDALRIIGTWDDLAVTWGNGQVALVDVTDPAAPLAVACLPIEAWHPGDTYPIGVVADHLVVDTFNQATYFHRLTADDPEVAVVTLSHEEVEEPPVLDGTRVMLPDAFKHVSLYDVDPIDGPSLLTARSLEAPLIYDGEVVGGFAIVDYDFAENVVTWVDMRGDLDLYEGRYYEEEQTGPCMVPLTAIASGDTAILQPWFDPTQRYAPSATDHGCESGLDPSPNTNYLVPSPDPNVGLVEKEEGLVAFDLVSMATSPISLPGSELGAVAAWLAPDAVAPSGAVVRAEIIGGDWFESTFTVVDIASGVAGESFTLGRLASGVAMPDALWALVDRDVTEFQDPIETPRLLVRVTSEGLQRFDLPEGATSGQLAVFGDRVYAVDAEQGRVDVFDTTPQLLRSVAWPDLEPWAKLAAGAPGLLARESAGRVGLIGPDAESVVGTAGCEQVLPVAALGDGFLAMRRAPRGGAYSPRWTVEALGLDASGELLTLVGGPSFPTDYPGSAMAIGQRAVVVGTMQVVDPLE